MPGDVWREINTTMREAIWDKRTGEQVGFVEDENGQYIVISAVGRFDRWRLHRADLAGARK
jgi:hypothetical protein